MKRCILTLMLLFIFLGNVLSQKDFRKGYIVSLNNDTTFGLIEYKGDKANSKYCLFKSEAGAEEVKIAPAQISSYRFIDSKYYVSKVLKIDSVEDTLFMEYLINGIVDFYYYRGNDGEHYLVDKGDGKLTELKNEQKIYKKEGRTYAREAKEYVGVLKYIFMKSPSIYKEVETISLKHKSLIKIANEYHNEVCTDKECIIYEKKLPLTRIVVGPLAGINRISFSVAENNLDKFYYLENSNFGSTVFPSIGLFAKVNMPFLNERLFLQYEGTYSKYSISTKNIYYNFSYDLHEIENDISLTQNAFNNSATIRYEIPVRKIRPTFHVGYFYNYYFKSDYYRQTSYTMDGESHTYEFEEYPFQKSDRGISLGLGMITSLSQRNIYLDLNFQRGFRISSYLNSNTFPLNLSLQVGKLK